MAKHRRKTPAKRTHHRRRRIGGIHGNFMNDAEQIVGLIGASIAAPIIQRMVTSINPKIVSGGQMLLGYYLKNHTKSPILNGAGWGFLSIGAVGLAHETRIIAGIEDLVAGIGDDSMNGFDEINGMDNQYMVSGIDGRHKVSPGGELVGDMSRYAVGM